MRSLFLDHILDLSIELGGQVFCDGINPSICVAFDIDELDLHVPKLLVDAKKLLGTQVIGEVSPVISLGLLRGYQSSALVANLAKRFDSDTVEQATWRSVGLRVNRRSWHGAYLKASLCRLGRLRRP